MKGRTPRTMQRERAGEILVDSGVIAFATEAGCANTDTTGDDAVGPVGFVINPGSSETERYPVAVVRDETGAVCGVEVVLGSTSIEHEAEAALGMLGLESHDGMWVSTMSSVCQTLWRNVAERTPDGTEEIRGSFPSSGHVFVGDPWGAQLRFELHGELEAVQWMSDGWLTRVGVRVKR